MFRLFALVSVWLLTLGCGPDAPVPVPLPPAATPAPAPVGTRRFLALGDSYTIGQGVPAADRWGVQLAWLAQAEGLRKPDIIARTGWTTEQLREAIVAANPPASYELVSLMIGVNNQFQGLPLAEYRNDFRELLHMAIRLAGGRPGRVLVLSIPDWGQSRVGRSHAQASISQEINQFNAAARQECTAAGVAFLDITDLTRTTGYDPAQFAPDGLHYSGLHMQQWAIRALPVVRRLVQ
ncbi:SGNH/GDSL hydrolase family protein [Hymenobacter canadensis]|uniref:SGNH/GDSL hydrolase family protein n=1 Tax=Hymenobacter canadensis TaxID=2999067 RepID=A0ABY7LIV6_9BACT|nr:SGNH/GDSL hydrolase family protein [Hymenobacter canadensis]WBA40385.1 SGNH/GDSL hydrolase family protein [Hymenobacter canadensis]